MGGKSAIPDERSPSINPFTKQVDWGARTGGITLRPTKLLRSRIYVMQPIHPNFAMYLVSIQSKK